MVNVGNYTYHTWMLWECHDYSIHVFFMAIYSLRNLVLGVNVYSHKSTRKILSEHFFGVNMAVHL